MKASKAAYILGGAIVVILVLLPFQALISTWLGASFGHIDLFRIWKELLMVPMAFIALWLVYSDARLKRWLNSSSLVLLILLYVLLHLGIGIYALKAGKVNASALIYALLINLRFLVFFLICVVATFKVPWLAQNWQKYILWPAVLVIIFGLLQQFILPVNTLSHFGYGQGTIPAYQTVDQQPRYVRAQSTLRGPNPLGAYLVLIITPTVGLLLGRRKNRAVLAVLAVAAVILLVFTYSRSAWLGAVLSLFILAWWGAKGQSAWLILMATAGVSALIIVGSIAAWRHNSLLQNTLFHTSQTSRSSESSNAVRTQAMLDGARNVIKRPLGSGPGTAGPASFRNNHHARIAENYFVQIGQEVGVLGLGLFIAINIVIAKLLWGERSKLLPRIMLATLVGLTLVNLLSHAWADDTLAYIFWGLLGITMSKGVILEQRAKTQKNVHIQ